MSKDTKITEIVKPETIQYLFEQPASPIRTHLIGKIITLEIIYRLIENGWEDFSESYNSRLIS